MLEYLEFFTNLIKTDGIVTALSVVFIIFLLLLIKDREKIVNGVFKLYITQKDKDKKIIIRDFENHRLMSKLDEWLKYRISNLNLTVEAYSDYIEKKIYKKEEINKRLWNAKKTLDIKLRIFYVGLKREQKKAIKAYKENNTQIMIEMIHPQYWKDLIYNAVKLYNDKFLESGGCRYFIQSFNKKHEKAVEIAVDGIDASLELSPYNDFLEKLHSIYDHLYYAFNWTLLDINDVLKMNGDLSEALTNWEIPDRDKK